MKLKPKHLEFVLHYLGTKDPGVAYSMVYPNASVQSLSAAASRIMARPEVQDYIQFTERRMEDRLLNQIEAEQEAKKQQLLSINEKRAVLTKIITGETKRVRFIKNKYGPQKVEEDLPVYAVLRAVDMDTRLETFYNILLHRQDWNYKQNTTAYINTPTLQQQVNILISQSATNRHCDEVSATPDTQEAISRNAETRMCEPSLPLENTPKQILSHITCPPLTHLVQEKSPARGFRGSLPQENPLAPHLTLPEKNDNQLTTEPDIYRVNSLTPPKKTALQLTKVNKNEKPVYNTTTKSTDSKKAPTPRPNGSAGRAWERAGGEAPIPVIDYNPYTLEPLDPNIDYSYNTHSKDPTIELYIAPTPGKITVKPSMRGYD